MKQWIAYTLLTILSHMGFAQGLPQDWYNQSALAFGLELGPNSWGINAIIQSDRLKDKSIVIHFSEIRSAYDIRYQSQDYFKDASTNQRLFPKSYLLGKINSLYNLGFTLQDRLLLSMQTMPNEFEIGLTYGIGAELGLAKPYYMQLLTLINLGDDKFASEIRNEKFSDQNKDKFTNLDYIYGRSRWSLGLKEIQVIPAAIAQLGLNARFGKQKEWYKEAYIQAQAHLYSQKVAINVSDSEKNFIPSLNFGVRLGKKW